MMRVRLRLGRCVLHRPVRGVGAGGAQVFIELREHLGFFGGEIFRFGEIGGEVVKFERGVVLEIAHGFPMAVQQRGLAEAAFVKFPIQKIVPLLLRVATEQGGREADGIKVRGRFDVCRSAAVARKSPK